MACSDSNSLDSDIASKEADKILAQLDNNPYLNDEKAINDGGKIFSKKCSQCHGPDGTGGPEAPDLTDTQTLRGSSDKEIFSIISLGTDKGMPRWKDELGASNIWKVMAYIKNIKEK